MDIKKILFPTDFLEGSSDALPYAIDLAKRYGAKLYIVHVIQDVTQATGWYVPHVSVDELYKDMEESARKELDRIFAEELRGFKDYENLIIRGTPAHEILDFCEKNDINLIVMGTHGRKGLDRLIFGSTAEKVVKNARCPVLTVRVS